MIIKEHGKLKLVEEKGAENQTWLSEGEGSLSRRFALLFRKMFSDLRHFVGLSLVNKLIFFISVVVFGAVVAFFALGFMDENFWGQTYLEKSLFNSILDGLFWPYLVLIWPAILISMVLGIYSGIQTGYIKIGRADRIASFFWDKMNELIDSMPKFVIILFIVFFMSAANESYQLILLIIIGILFVPVIYIHFKKRVQWLANQHFIDAERIVGQKAWRIKLIQIFWRNCRMLAISQFFYLYANIILADACLGFLGVRQLRFPSLGGLLAAEIGFYEVSFLPVFIPAAAISLLIIILNLAGNYFKNKYRSQNETEIKFYVL